MARPRRLRRLPETSGPVALAGGVILVTGAARVIGSRLPLGCVLGSDSDRSSMVKEAIPLSQRTPETGTAWASRSELTDV